MRTITGIATLIAIGILFAGVADAQSARAELKDANGNTVGEAVLDQRGDDVQITTNFTGIPAGNAGKRIACGVIHR